MKKQIAITILALTITFAGGCAAPHTLPSKSSASSALTSSFPASSNSAASSKPTDIIPELAAADIKLNLEKWIPSADAQNGADGDVYWQSTGTDADTGIRMSYNIQGHSPTEITGAAFDVINENGSTNFIDFAKGFLGMCSTIPYAGANQKAARSWVESNIANVSAGHPAETTIAGVNFSLSGGPQARTLEISKAE